MIKRVATVGIAAGLSIVASATAALAETTYPIAPNSGGSVAGAGGTAFTGASGVPFGMVMVVALMVVGVAALLVARRWGTRFGS